MSLDIFETGKSNQLFSGESGEECNSLASIRAYAAQLRDGNFIGNDRHVRPKSSFSDAEVRLRAAVTAGQPSAPLARTPGRRALHVPRVLHLTRTMLPVPRASRWSSFCTAVQVDM